MTERIPRTKDNLDKCNCITCSSYTTKCKIKELPNNMTGIVKGLNNVDHLEGMFCAYEKSRCIEKPQGCSCSSCKLHDEYHLEKSYYCLANDGE